MAPPSITPAATCTTGTITLSEGHRAATISEACGTVASAGSTLTAPGKDRLELSDRGRLLSEADGFASRLRKLPDVRPEAVERARRLIESGELFNKDAVRQAAKSLRDLLGN